MGTAEQNVRDDESADYEKDVYAKSADVEKLVWQSKWRNGAVGDYNERGRNKPQNLDVIEQLLIRPFGAFYMALGYFRRPALPATAGRFYKRTQDVSGLWVGVRRQDADGRNCGTASEIAEQKH
ncbi:hypothetical protein [Pseudomonas sp. AF03-9]|uniref:hypothetical protein n=1 Tax=Pseudomonas sp. AF03-9 TaxID=2849867 RepID=UPI001CFC3AEA|nr:hypothetical protein [Pseudomonas sp. AF03-9]